jgi:hypothetical protein
VELLHFFILRYEDPRKAKNCLFLGLALMIIGIIFNIFITAAIPEFDSGFNVNL